MRLTSSLLVQPSVVSLAQPSRAPPKQLILSSPSPALASSTQYIAAFDQQSFSLSGLALVAATIIHRLPPLSPWRKRLSLPDLPIDIVDLILDHLKASESIELPKEIYGSIPVFIGDLKLPVATSAIVNPIAPLTLVSKAFYNVLSRHPYLTIRLSRFDYDEVEEVLAHLASHTDLGCRVRRVVVDCTAGIVPWRQSLWNPEARDSDGPGQIGWLKLGTLLRNLVNLTELELSARPFSSRATLPAHLGWDDMPFRLKAFTASHIWDVKPLLPFLYSQENLRKIICTSCFCGSDLATSPPAYKLPFLRSLTCESALLVAFASSPLTFLRVLSPGEGVERRLFASLQSPLWRCTLTKLETSQELLLRATRFTKTARLLKMISECVPMLQELITGNYSASLLCDFEVDSSIEEVLEAISSFQHLRMLSFKPIRAKGSRRVTGKGDTLWYVFTAYGQQEAKESFMFELFDRTPTLDSFICAVHLPFEDLRPLWRKEVYERRRVVHIIGDLKLDSQEWVSAPISWECKAEEFLQAR